MKKNIDLTKVERLKSVYEKKIFNRRYDHLNFRYVKNRLNQIIYEIRKPDEPWLNPQANKLLSTLIKKEDVGIEFGSGRSTFWFGERLKSLISIEHDSRWFEFVEKNIRNKGFTEKVKIYLHKTEKDYLSIINELKDNSIDFCLIDGIYRDLCADAMIPKIASGGIFIIDDAQIFIPNDETFSLDARKKIHGYSRQSWKEIDQKIKSWRLIKTTNGISDTYIYIKR